MPIFEYLCRRCGHRFEELVLTAKPRLACPRCDSPRAQKLVSRVYAHKSETQRLRDFSPEDLRDPSFTRDMRNVGLATQKKLKKTGVDLGDAFAAKLDEARSGKILKA